MKSLKPASGNENGRLLMGRGSASFQRNDGFTTVRLKVKVVMEINPCRSNMLTAVLNIKYREMTFNLLSPSGKFLYHRV